MFSPLSFKLIEVAPCVADPLQTQVIDEVQRAAGPFVVLVLLVRSEDELRDSERIPGTMGLDIFRLLGEAIEESLADQAVLTNP